MLSQTSTTNGKDTQISNILVSSRFSCMRVLTSPNSILSVVMVPLSKDSCDSLDHKLSRFLTSSVLVLVVYFGSLMSELFEDPRDSQGCEGSFQAMF